MPDVVLTASGTDALLKKGVMDKSHQYWELKMNDREGVEIMQYKHDGCYLGVDNHRIVVKKNARSGELWQFRPVTKNS